MDRRALLLIVLAVSGGCRQLLGIDYFADPVDATAQPGEGGPRDGIGVDTLAPADCMTRWQTTPVFDTPMPLTTLNTSSDEDHPFLDPLEKTIYFTRNADIYTATRTAIATDFGTDTLETSLSSMQANEGKAFINSDGTRAFFASDRVGTSGGFDLWRGVRQGTTGAFTVDRTYIDTVDDDRSQVDPHLSVDLLHLYYIPATGPSQRIALSTRANTNQDFGNPMPITEIAGATGADAGPTLVEDESVIVFSSTRDGSEHLYYAFRTATNAGFSTPKPVPHVNGAAGIDTAPHISRDGCRLYWSSTRDGNRDLFVAKML